MKCSYIFTPSALLIACLVAAAEEPKSVAVSNKLAHIQISGEVYHGPAHPEQGRIDKKLGSILGRLEKAAKDPAINCVFLELRGVDCGHATAEELRHALASIRAGGKSIVAFTNEGSSDDVLIGLAANQLWMPESAWMMLVGVRSQVFMYRDLFELVGIRADFLKVGDFKSAVEPYTRNTLSEPARRQMNEMLDDIFNNTIVAALTESAKSKGIKTENAKAIIDKAPMSARAAKQEGLIHDIGYKEKAKSAALALAGKDSIMVPDYAKPNSEELDLSNPFALLKALSGPKTKSSKDAKIAIIHVHGAIDTGKSSSGLNGPVAGSETIIEAITQAEEDATVKGFVLRINSPGGSASASDFIWERLNRCKKPWAVSMSDVAASGGYYIAAPSARIFAEPSSITGSIGVFGGKLVIGDALAKVGLKSEVISRGANAGVLSTDRIFSPSERLAMELLIDETYKQFIDKVLAGRQAAGRKDMNRESLLKIAGGRVWTGRQALTQGLVDELGDLKNAVAWVREKANLPRDKNIETLDLPKSRPLLDELIDGAFGLPFSFQNGMERLLFQGKPPAALLQALQLTTLKGGPVFMLPLEPFNIR